MCKVTSKPSLAKQTCRILSRYFGEDGKDKRPVNDLNNIFDTISDSFDLSENDVRDGILLSKYLDIYKRNQRLLNTKTEMIDRKDLMQILETICNDCRKVSERLTKYIEGIKDFNSTCEF